MTEETCDCYACRLSELIESVQDEMTPTEVIMITFKVIDRHLTQNSLAGMDVHGEC